MTQTDPSPRFVVRSITGYGEAVSGSAPLTTAYWVSDRDYEREVASFYVRRGSHDHALRKAAETFAEIANAWYDAWLAEETD